jgi:hypothetical protein
MFDRIYRKLKKPFIPREMTSIRQGKMWNQPGPDGRPVKEHVMESLIKDGVLTWVRGSKGGKLLGPGPNLKNFLAEK